METDAPSAGDTFMKTMPPLIGSRSFELIADSQAVEPAISRGVNFKADLASVAGVNVPVSNPRNPTAIPEPSSIVMGLIGTGMILGIAVRHRRVARA